MGLALEGTRHMPGVGEETLAGRAPHGARAAWAWLHGRWAQKKMRDKKPGVWWEKRKGCDGVKRGEGGVVLGG